MKRNTRVTRNTAAHTPPPTTTLLKIPLSRVLPWLSLPYTSLGDIKRTYVYAAAAAGRFNISSTVCLHHRHEIPATRVQYSTTSSNLKPKRQKKREIATTRSPPTTAATPTFRGRSLPRFVPRALENCMDVSTQYSSTTIGVYCLPSAGSR